MTAALFALRLVLVYPGAPGSPQEATEFLATLQGYVERKAGLAAGSLPVSYHDELAAGVAALEDPAPAVAVATLPALCSAGRLPYSYVGSPELSGRATESYSLVVPAGAVAAGPLPLASFKGKRLTGTLLSSVEFVERLLYRSQLSLADVTLVPRPSALLAIKAVREGQADAALLTQTQVEALTGIVPAGSVATAWTSEPVPGAPVIALGSADRKSVEAIQRAFLGMCADPEGAELCDTMGVTGFIATGEKELEAALATCWGAP